MSSTSPDGGATSASKTAPVTATFGEAVDPATVTTASFTLTSDAGAVRGAVAYDAASRTARFTPASVLVPSTSYTATVFGVEDTAGNPMESPHVWSFTTAVPAAGELDPTFGTLGATRTDLGRTSDQALGMAIQADDKIVVVGANGYTSAVVRYDPDGTLDPTFGTSGVVAPSLSGCAVPSFRAVVVQGDGKIVVAGYCSRAGVARYLSDGSLDTTFGTAGIAWLGTGNVANAVALDANDNIVVAGESGWYSTETDSSDFWVARLTSTTGALDPSFSSDGHAFANFKPSSYTYGSSLSDVAWGVAVAPSGMIVLAGEAEDDTWTRNAAMAFFNPDGTFHSKGTTGTWLKDCYARAVAIGAGGGIVAAGVMDNWHLGLFESGSGTAIDLKGDGSTSEDRAYALAIQGDGKIVVAGRVQGSGSAKDFAMLRYGAGAVDASFGVNGRVFTDGGYADDTLTAIGLQSDGKIVAAGTSGGDVVVLRYVP